MTVSPPAISLQVTLFLKAILALILGALLLGWGWQQWLGAMANHDLFWLYTGFLRLTQGQTMAQSFYETNPPLSVFIYTPAFWIAQQDWLSLPHAIFVYTLTLVALSALATRDVLRRAGLDRCQTALICLGLIICGTVLTPPNLGQRDHLLALAAFPLMILLLTRTRGYEAPALVAAPILFFGTFFLLLKPYYGLLPAALMVHRAITQKRISAFWDTDFLVMAAATLLYAVSVWRFFPDYITIILPDVVALYADTGWSVNLLRVFFIISIWFILMGLSVPRRKVSNYVRPFLYFSALSFIIFIMMFKGYAYHLLPCLTFLYVALLLVADGLLRGLIREPVIRMLSLCLIVSGLMLAIPHSFFPERDKIIKEEITQIVAGCGDDCKFLLMGGTVRTTQLISYYGGKPHASRFPKFWFLEGLVGEGLNQKTSENPLGPYHHYADMIAEDIDFYKPQIIFSCDYIVKHVELLSHYESFRKNFASYKVVRDFSYNYAVFHGRRPGRADKIVPCTLYQRSE